MVFFYTFFIAFILIFVSELGDKTQLIVLSFSNKLKSSSILLGVTLGSLFSHGFAIFFGSYLGLINDNAHFYLSLLTYLSFICLGFWGFCHMSPKSSTDTSSNSGHNSFIHNLSHMHLHFVLLIAVSIFIGEFGDKTFLASLGLGVQYPCFKFPLILGAISGMVISNSLAICFGKFLDRRVRPIWIHFFSNLLFIILGVFGLLKFL